ncbi:putative amp dependent CoA ligase [Eremomyces bilateralis CBS 781.70]|uniref:Amp dependent CoA ligase n=1 Tax=Eremomyces bilateralis CBS 781.70 TaxID=1392243 RepID=A0A6G1FPV0_9PEZI|nr:putative amp dependent CoA ligase [Eremomyces bilateralis CBS 781.70]KAF1807817.1 putative amp dependent CoA ligase [Eremomyces bilateralis CBS 781.70]
MSPHPLAGPYTPLSVDGTLSLSQFMVRFNPDNVPNAKVIHTDTILNKHITYGGLREQAAACAWGLRNLGLGAGKTLLALVPNSTDFVLLAHSTWWSGACFSPANPSATATEIAHFLTLVKPDVVATTPQQLPSLRKGLTLAGCQATIITLISRSAGLPLFPDDITGRTKDEVAPVYDLASDGLDGKTAPAVICFSSGTTGKVKGVVLSHYNLISNVLQFRCSLPSMANSSAREVFFPPYCHIYGLSCVVLQAMWLGAFVCGIPAFDLELFCEKMAEYKANWVHVVPPVAIMLADSDIPLKYDLSSLRRIVIAAAPTKYSLQMRLKDRFSGSVLVLQGYGLSECSPSVLHQHESDEADIGTVGKVLSGTLVRLVNANTHEDVAPGEDGELWVRGPQVMLGYVGDPEATAKSFSSGWLKTGDIMRVDQKGNFWVVDRLKELIKYKGFQVAPSELEDLLISHPYVLEAAVTSIYDDTQATELPRAYVTLTKEVMARHDLNVEEALQEIHQWLDGQVAGYKKLRGGIFYMRELPKTASGKILRRLLRSATPQASPSKL